MRVKDDEARATALYARYRAAIAGRALPLAIVDLEAFDANVDAIARACGSKKLRVATKSIRSVDLTRRVTDRLGESAIGLMTYTATETAKLAELGFRDLLLAYPTAQKIDAELLANACANGATAAVVVDAVEHLEALAPSARAARAKVPVVIELDMALRPARGVHLGVRRSPVRTAEDVVALARRIASTEGLSFHGVMGYEAQIAGVPDHEANESILDAAKRAMKAVSRDDVARKRRDVARALREASLAPTIFNGGGTGSLGSSSREDALTEVTAGSGFLASHLFDGYRDLSLVPAAYFALQVVRVPDSGFVTCHGGGYVASGGAGASRLPVPALPHGLALTKLEGAGEVQTPVTLPRGVTIAIGDPIFFRHAKAGELAEHFEEYALVRGDRVEGRARTYRGSGWSFLG